MQEALGSCEEELVPDVEAGLAQEDPLFRRQGSVLGHINLTRECLGTGDT